MTPEEEFVVEVAGLLKDGETDADGETFILENDDAVDTLHGLISEARAIAGVEDP
jgi:hypothetical protein